MARSPVLSAPETATSPSLPAIEAKRSGTSANARPVRSTTAAGHSPWPGCPRAGANRLAVNAALATSTMVGPAGTSHRIDPNRPAATETIPMNAAALRVRSDRHQRHGQGMGGGQRHRRLDGRSEHGGGSSVRPGHVSGRHPLVESLDARHPSLTRAGPGSGRPDGFRTRNHDAPSAPPWATVRDRDGFNVTVASSTGVWVPGDTGRDPAGPRSPLCMVPSIDRPQPVSTGRPAFPKIGAASAGPPEPVVITVQGE